MPSPLIAVVEDEPEIRELLEELLTSEGYHTVAWDSATGAWRLIRDVQPDLVILDVRLGETGAGEALLARLEEDEATERIPVIICSGDIDVLFKREAQFRAHGHGVVMKPFHVDALLNAITAASVQRRQPPWSAAGSARTAVKTRRIVKRARPAVRGTRRAAQY